MTSSITDRILPQAGIFQFESEASILNKSMNFAAGRLTESLRILVSLVEQVVVRTLYYTTFPTKWVTPSIHERLSNQLSASNQSLKNGLYHFAAIKKPATEPASLEKPLTFLEKLRGHLPKISTRTALAGVAIGVIGISLYYFGPVLASKLLSNAGEQLPPAKPLSNLGTSPIPGVTSLLPENPSDTPLASTIPAQEAVHNAASAAAEATAADTVLKGANQAANEWNKHSLLAIGSAGTNNAAPFNTKLTLTEKIFNSAIQASQQIPPGHEYPFQVQDGSTTCSGVIQNLGSVGVLQTSCEEQVTKHTSYFQSQLLRSTPKGTTFEVGPLAKYQPAKLQKCLQDACTPVVQNCWNKARDILSQLQCQALQQQCPQQHSASCLQKVSQVVAEYPPFKCDAVNGQFINCQVV